MNSTKDLATKHYWDKLWKSSRQDLHWIKDTEPVTRRMVALFRRHLPEVPGLKLLEIGCAYSGWLVYFREKFGYEVWGMDYSEPACRETAALLERNHVSLGGRVLCRDLFAEPEDLKERFDVVFTAGVVEHFTDLPEVIGRCAGFLKNGGRMITEIPNTAGGAFALQKIIDRKVYDVHRSIDARRLRAAHEQVGLTVSFCDYVGAFAPSVLNYARFPWPVRRLTDKSFKVSTAAVHALFRLCGKYPETRFFSPYTVCIAHKEAESGRLSV